jgi:hypothetical protein
MAVSGSIWTRGSMPLTSGSGSGFGSGSATLAVSILNYRYGDGAELPELRAAVPERGASGVPVSGPAVARHPLPGPRPDARLLAHARPDARHSRGGRRLLSATLRQVRG